MKDLPNPFAGDTMQGYKKIAEVKENTSSIEEAAEKMKDCLKIFSEKAVSFVYDLTVVLHEVVLPFCYLVSVLSAFYFSFFRTDSVERLLSVFVLYVLLRFYRDLFYKEEHYVRKR